MVDWDDENLIYEDFGNSATPKNDDDEWNNPNLVFEDVGKAPAVGSGPNPPPTASTQPAPTAGGTPPPTAPPAADPEQEAQEAKSIFEQMGQGAAQTMMDLGQVTPALESAASFISSLYGIPLSGVAGIMGLLHSPDKANELIEQVQKYTIYQPQTEGGERLLGAAMYPMEKLSEGAGVVADPVAARFGPVAGAAIKTGIEALPMLAAPGARAAKAVKAGKRKIGQKLTSEGERTRVQAFQEVGEIITKGERTQKYGDLLKEKRLSESLSTPGEGFRSAMAKRSEGLKAKLSAVAGSDAGLKLYEIAKKAGDRIKSALDSRKKVLAKDRRMYYEEAYEAGADLKSVHILPDEMVSAMPKPDVLTRIYRAAGETPKLVEAFDSLIAEFGLEKQLLPKDRQGVYQGKVEPLSIANFEEFRKGLNRISRQDTKGALKELTGPLKEALDTELTRARSYKGTENLPPEILDAFENARKTFIEEKTQFSPDQLTGKLVGTKKDGLTPVIEGSKAVETIMRQPVEQITNTIHNLSKSRTKGKEAIKTLQSAVVLDLVEAAFRQDGTFNPKAYRNRLRSIGPNKLEAVFKNHPQGMRTIKNFETIAKSVTNKVKDRATIYDRVLNSFGVVNMAARIPGVNMIIAGLKFGSESVGGSYYKGKALKQPKTDMPDLTAFSKRYPKIAAAILAAETQVARNEE